MSACDQIRLLLGPFDDGELEPHEMEDVALHVVSCPDCKAMLEECRSLGVALRGSIYQPLMDGFSQAVMARIERLPVPLRIRLSRYFDTLTERFGAGLAIGAAGALAAVLTVVLATPYTHRYFSRHSSVQIASARNTMRIPERSDDIAPALAVPLPDPDFQAGAQDLFNPEESPAPASPMLAASSTFNTPMIAVSDDPKIATTVIWMPNQQ